ncbi:cyclic nucleotide-binding domain-containing protein [Sinorhizobium medicae]|uniref:Cyclic nucleotide-binding protein n=1 Tax=Sinorhizobium medicae (strain WSM419) TaxID=366394 RepID=A6ULT9_SINMW|nr:Crp/Fnr family transcriptional regulator [Sinorhizobium medicae]ABR64619.1 cyclic nucleotide-binding protein [Sinorhizobium medicae WSM419]MDX0413761.1 cyclic nucleotide-binding domain-containing protein [Sinorhizobium medicae]MDX0426145.1 cyclic nucleotide-binding domain-containing protein [Sinorhizobium medicae]MDX0431676.1 cyclic nucleotide-binding domain-containing protein [Sinorhizobium medicae]MDX0436547.1 cyclic nucleotide-binding domain-containing protein [Sinorhizobium medicae]
METLQLTSSDWTTLLGSRFFVRLPRSTVEAILEETRLSTYEEHDVLFHQGDSIGDVFFVLSGLIRLYRVGKDRREADVAVLSKGEMFAENAIYLGRATASAEAAEASVIARIDSSKLRKIAAADPDVAQAFIEHLCHRGKMTEDMLAQDRLLTATQRVASYILSHCPNGTNTSFSFRLPFQKNILAGKLGVAPEALSRAFSTLRQSGVIVKGRMIEIHDRHALERF